MRTTPKTEKEIQEASLLPNGWYPFEIVAAEEKTSKKGNEMIELNTKVYKDSGFVFVKDWLMDTEFGAFKLRHCAETCNLLDEYEGGGIDADSLVGKEGYVKIGVQKSKDPQFPDKNQIQDYAKDMPVRKNEAAVGKPNKPNLAEPEDDDTDIPF